MKVTTDSCLFGAWYADKWKNADGNILDIGSGTGLLTLMLLQKTNVNIHGIEISDTCFQQLQSNVNNSPWPQRTRLIHADARDTVFQNKYDFIICNPPFHENQLKSREYGKDTAHHSILFTLDDLLKVADQCLQPGGKLAVLLPFYRVNNFIGQAVLHDFYTEELVCVQQSPGHDYFRGMLLLSRNPSVIMERTYISITNDKRDYTPEFIHLLQDYYLNL